MSTRSTSVQALNDRMSERFRSSETIMAVRLSQALLLCCETFSSNEAPFIQIGRRARVDKTDRCSSANAMRALGPNANQRLRCNQTTGRRPRLPGSSSSRLTRLISGTLSEALKSLGLLGCRFFRMARLNDWACCENVLQLRQLESQDYRSRRALALTSDLTRFAHHRTGRWDNGSLRRRVSGWMRIYVTLFTHQSSSWP